MLPELRPDKMSNRALRPADLEERRKRRKRAEMIEKIPVLAVSGASRNRNLMKLSSLLSLTAKLTYFQAEARPGGESAERWTELRARSEDGDGVCGRHQERRGGPRYSHYIVIWPLWSSNRLHL